jgi:hypothetical protein
MLNKERKPAWWQLYILVPVMLGLILVEQLDPLPGIASEIVDLSVVVLTFGTMLAWMRINSGLIEFEEMEKDESLRYLNITLYDPQSDTSNDLGESNLWTPSMIPHPANPIPVGRQGEQEDTEKWSLN